MKISLEWLKEYVDYNGTVEQLDDMLTAAGFPIEEIQKVGDDWMLDVEVTSNRPDMLGHIGVAREVATLTGCKFKMPDIQLKEAGDDINKQTSVTIKNPDLCKRYTARLINDVKVGASPNWMRKRLETIGLRSISNIVDVTNYVMMEIGQPLHAFDFEKLDGSCIIVRTALPGERIETIDHVKHDLKKEMLCIADSGKAVALAGVMGGVHSEVSDETTTVLLESAHFAPLTIRKTARELVMGSDSSFRFERDVDVEMADWASQRAAQLFVETAGGSIAPGVIDQWNRQDCQKVQMRISRLKKLLGLEIPTNTIMDIFSKLGFAPILTDDIIECEVPSWRVGDISREVDLIEEVIRVHGLDHIPTEKKIHIRVAKADSRTTTRQIVTQALNACGYYETISVGFANEEDWPLFAAEGFEPLRVSEATRKANNAMRPSLLPSLMAIRRHNQNAGNKRCDIFEVASVHEKGNAGIIERFMLGLVTDGDFRELRGALETLITKVDKEAQLVCKPAEISWGQQGAGAELVVNGKVIGKAAIASKKVCKAFDLENPVAIAEVDMQALMDLESKVPQLKEIIRFPAIVRDLSLVMDEQVQWQDIEETIWSADIEDMRKVNFVEIYRGKGIDKGKKSLMLSMEFRHAGETLTHDQAEEYQNKVLELLKGKFAVQLRA
ncbi:MAG: phenylalanine--tRNA ligase subunit beta [Phycisphaerae bacterium]|nr:phenylalanine--tRNA ligase subunit beta [Phycisphaerae bacterium]